MSHFCENCAPRFETPCIFPESRKEDEKICDFCRFHAAETLFKGKPSCFSCKKLEKTLKTPAFSQENPKPLSPIHKHNKTSVGFSFFLNFPRIFRNFPNIS